MQASKGLIANVQDKTRELLTTFIRNIMSSVRVKIEDVTLVMENEIYGDEKPSDMKLKDSFVPNTVKSLVCRLQGVEFFDDSKDAQGTASTKTTTKKLRMTNFRIEMWDRPRSGMYIKIPGHLLSASSSDSFAVADVDGDDIEPISSVALISHDSRKQTDELTITIEKTYSSSDNRAPRSSASPARALPQASTSRNIAIGLTIAPFTVHVDPISIKFLASLSAKLLEYTLVNEPQQTIAKSAPSVPSHGASTSPSVPNPSLNEVQLVPPSRETEMTAEDRRLFEEALSGGGNDPDLDYSFQLYDPLTRDSMFVLVLIAFVL